METRVTSSPHAAHLSQGSIGYGLSVYDGQFLNVKLNGLNSDILNYEIQFEYPKRLLESPFEEAVNAAIKLNQSTEKTIYLCLSGGADSEAMLSAFITAKIPFKTVFLEFEYGLNAHELFDMRRMVLRYGIQPEIIRMDFEKFFDSQDMVNFIKDYFCFDYIHPYHLYLASKIDGFVVFSGTPAPIKQIDSSISFCLPAAGHFALDYFIQEQCRGGVGHFFLYTPELIVACALHDLRRGILRSPDEDRGFTAAFVKKKMRFANYGWNLLDRPFKFVGTELAIKFFREKLDRDLVLEGNKKVSDVYNYGGDLPAYPFGGEIDLYLERFVSWR